MAASEELDPYAVRVTSARTCCRRLAHETPENEHPGVAVVLNAFHPRLSPKWIRLMHGTLLAALNQGIAWGMLKRNPAIGIKSPRKKAAETHRDSPVARTFAG